MSSNKKRKLFSSFCNTERRTCALCLESVPVMYLIPHTEDCLKTMKEILKSPESWDFKNDSLLQINEHQYNNESFFDEADIDEQDRSEITEILNSSVEGGKLLHLQFLIFL